VNPSDLRAHKDPFRTPFNPSSSNRRFQSVAESLDFAKDQKYTILVSLHGGDGENGLFQKECENRFLGFTASGSTASALAMNKVKAKKRAKDRGLLTAEYLTFNAIKEQTKIDLNLFLKQFKRIVLKPVS
jgi:D-alanine-D-alanine ligase-like ATP-grasp enzyme